MGRVRVWCRWLNEDFLSNLACSKAVKCLLTYGIQNKIQQWTLRPVWKAAMISTRFQQVESQVDYNWRQPIWWKNSLRQPSLYTVLYCIIIEKPILKKGLCFYKSALLTYCGLPTIILRKYLNVLDTNNLYKVLWEKNRFVRQSNDTLIYWNWFSWRKCLGFHVSTHCTLYLWQRNKRRYV